MAAASTITVCSKLPFDFVAEAGGKTVRFRGAKSVDPVTGEPYLTGGYGFTPDVDAAWFEAWKKEVGDFRALQTGAIFASDASKAQDEAKEMAPEVRTGLEQKTPDQLGVEVVAEENEGGKRGKR